MTHKCLRGTDATVYLIGNKVDLRKSKREIEMLGAQGKKPVTYEEGSAVAKGPLSPSFTLIADLIVEQRSERIMRNVQLKRGLAYKSCLMLLWTRIYKARKGRS